ncbi:alpha amylase C-terminal domain-containing protein [Streptomonospora sp. S1-112]|uniref:Alpha-amylase n=1 Tax=Streptomonospora mangrovi TaxID=2883123 RepID=A0A9X3NW94_9ACTN|nr:carbohydrate-binding module family 20 domain-containing protein [Streptomonospora mangrovi]MDA0565431.1 alpha amylase C-terminal domain-containing protein [Streptomonospora mangrovi]
MKQPPRLGAAAVSAVLIATAAAALTAWPGAAAADRDSDPAPRPPSSAADAPAAAPAADSGGTAAQANGDVIVHLFQWRWESVAQECEDVLGPNGYGAVQVSPPQEHVVLAEEEHPWWQDYQPVSYSVDNTRRGTRADFADMVARCRDAGVRIYVDAVVNHMTGTGSIGSGPGSAGSTYAKYDYPAVPYGDGDFGDCRRDVADWTDPAEVQGCELLALSDLDTGSAHVRGAIADYLNDLVGLGVAGFRVDAAKHVPAEDLAAIYARLDEVPGYGGRPYVFQEVLDGGGPESIRPPGYTHLGDVIDDRYHSRVGAQIRDGRLGDVLETVRTGMAVESDQAVVFVDNHDTQRSAPSISYQAMGQRHVLGQALTLAQPYGTPKVMSSYRFDSSDQGPPTTGTEAGNPAGALTAPTDCSGERWFCEHRDLNAMPTFANAVGDAPVVERAEDGAARIAFDRGERGFAAFNAGGSAWTLTSATGLPDGRYCDVANGTIGPDGSCDSAGYAVSEGEVTVTVPPNGAVALHVDALCAEGAPCAEDGGPPDEECANVTAAFSVRAQTWYGQDVRVVGSVPALGSWDPQRGVRLATDEDTYPTWRGEVDLPEGTAFEYKLVKVAPDGAVEWESGANRAAAVDSPDAECVQAFTGEWR